MVSGDRNGDREREMSGQVIEKNKKRVLDALNKNYVKKY